MIYGVNFRQCSLSQSQEGDVLSYSECKLGKNFQVFASGPHWGGLKAPPQTPQLHNSFSPRNARRKIGTPQKLLDTTLYTSVLIWAWQDKFFQIIKAFSGKLKQ